MEFTNDTNKKTNSIRRLTKEEQLIGYIERLKEVIVLYQTELFIAEQELQKVQEARLEANNEKIYQKGLND